MTDDAVIGHQAAVSCVRDRHTRNIIFPTSSTAKPLTISTIGLVNYLQ
ncbi:MAG: hypothetical protein PUP93_20025 [Rhizonema sp. NSF051]|nr:hypothetical protein [Rhizonema sp. NSF051]